MKIIKELSLFVPEITAVIGFVDKDKKGNLYNSAAILQNKKICAIYHKNNLVAEILFIQTADIVFINHLNVRFLIINR
jgi:predicted amidohydrolase